MHGRENFQMITLETCPLDGMDEREIFWIKRMNSLAPFGYNLSEGGGRVTFTDEMRQAVSKRRLGSKTSEETRIKQRFAHLGEKNWNWGLSMDHAQKVAQYDLSGKLVKIHENITEATRSVVGKECTGEEFKNKKHNIAASITGACGQKTAHQMIWRYQKNGENAVHLIEVPRYKCLPTYMKATLPFIDLEDLIAKAKLLPLKQEHFPHNGIQNANSKIPFSTELQTLAFVEWCAEHLYYVDTRNPSIIIHKQEIVRRLKGMTSWTMYQRAIQNAGPI
jgi:hypothetical protein